MRSAAELFIGTHDFSSFTANPGYKRKSTVRNISHCSIRKSGPLITVIIRGEGFLYKMCRGMAGTLVQVGLGKLRPNEIQSILVKKDRRVAGMTAPAHGLVLWKVFYGGPKKSEGSTTAESAK
jgi:tRNA pseudouridine38-40 synthase